MSLDFGPRCGTVGSFCLVSVTLYKTWILVLKIYRFLVISLFHVKCFRCMFLSVVSALCSLSPPFCLFSVVADEGRVMFNACSLCCTQCRRMGSSPLISNKRLLETRQAQHRSSSSKVWNDVDIDVCPGPSTVSSWASHQQGTSCLE